MINSIFHSNIHSLNKVNKNLCSEQLDSQQININSVLIELIIKLVFSIPLYVERTVFYQLNKVVAFYGTYEIEGIYDINTLLANNEIKLHKGYISSLDMNVYIIFSELNILIFKPKVSFNSIVRLILIHNLSQLRISEISKTNTNKNLKNSKNDKNRELDHLLEFYTTFKELSTIKIQFKEEVAITIVSQFNALKNRLETDFDIFNEDFYYRNQLNNNYSSFSSKLDNSFNIKDVNDNSFSFKYLNKLLNNKNDIKDLKDTKIIKKKSSINNPINETNVTDYSTNSRNDIDSYNDNNDELTHNSNYGIINKSNVEYLKIIKQESNHSLEDCNLTFNTKKNLQSSSKNLKSIGKNSLKEKINHTIQNKINNNDDNNNISSFSFSNKHLSKLNTTDNDNKCFKSTISYSSNPGIRDYSQTMIANKKLKQKEKQCIYDLAALEKVLTNRLSLFEKIITQTCSLKDREYSNNSNKINGKQKVSSDSYSSNLLKTDLNENNDSLNESMEVVSPLLQKINKYGILNFLTPEIIYLYQIIIEVCSINCNSKLSNYIIDFRSLLERVEIVKKAFFTIT